MHQTQPYQQYPAYQNQDQTGVEQQYAASSYYQQAPAEYNYQADGVTPMPQASAVRSWFDFSDSGYLKGFMLGAGVTLLLTNDTVQRALVKGAVKTWSLFQGGVEEVKEQFRDVKAEMSHEE